MQKRFVVTLITGACHKCCTHGMGVAHRLTHAQTGGLGFGVQRGDDLHIGLLGHHGQRPILQAPRGADQPFSPQTGEPQREYSAFGHRQTSKCSHFVLI